MSHDKPSLIAPPPSVGDVLTSLTADEPRIGRVDFSTRLAAEAEAKAAATDAAVEEAAPEATQDVAESEGTEEVAEPPAPVTEPPAPVTEPPAPVVEPPAPVVEPVETTPQPPAPRMAGTVAHEAPRDLVRSVGEVADAVVARMHQAEVATQQHLAALEAEALRRCELLTAQAELDAELIRLHARREAHAIVTAARMRAGEGSPDEESTALIEMGDALAHVAEITEIALAPKKKRAPRRIEKP